MNKQFAATLVAVGSAALGSFYYGGYKERQKLGEILPLEQVQQMELLHKVS